MAREGCKNLEHVRKWRGFKVDIGKQNLMGSDKNNQRLKANSQGQTDRNDSHWGSNRKILVLEKY